MKKYEPGHLLYDAIADIFYFTFALQPGRQYYVSYWARWDNSDVNCMLSTVGLEEIIAT